MAPAPTHSVKHVNGWQANIYIAPSLQAQLNHRNTFERDNARSSVCKRFKEACRHKFADFGLSHVEWRDLTVMPLRPSSPPAQRTSAPQSQLTQEDGRHCCGDDDCKVCDDGNHGFCRKGCTLFSPAPRS